jgi:hypothetical protein
MLNRGILRWCGSALAIVAAVIVLQARAESNRPEDQLAVTRAGPRHVEDTTKKAILRDYSEAWRAMITSLDDNNEVALDSPFIGTAHEELMARIQDQKRTGVRTRISDRGHKLEAVFYSPEGSVLQLHDSANVEIELLDGDRVIHSEQTTLHYVVLMTVAEDRWKVRLFQAVPAF